MAVINLSNPKKMQDKVLELFRCGMSGSDICFELSSTAQYRLPSHLMTGKEVSIEALEHEVSNAIDKFESKDLVQLIYSNKLIKPQNADVYYVYNIEKQEILASIKPDTMKEVLKGEGYKALVKYGLEEGYNPKNCKRFFTDNGRSYFNTYIPPKWKYDYWYKNVPITTIEIPTCYTKFLMHLTDNREADVNYILDWLAISLQSRNFTYLVTVGGPGIGKGVLGSIMQKLHGDENYVTLGGSSIKKQFNKQLYGRTLVYFNEIYDISGEVSEKIKLLNESKQEIERKGIDAEVMENYSNIYFSSNKYDSIKLDEQQRRFSFIDLTEKKYDFIAENGAELTEDSNIELLARNLFNRRYNEAYLTIPYKSETTKFISESRLEGWQVYMREEIVARYAGKSISVSDLFSVLQHVPFKLKYQDVRMFAKENPSLFKVVQKDPKSCDLFLDKISMKLTANPAVCNSESDKTHIVQVLSKKS